MAKSQTNGAASRPETGVTSAHAAAPFDPSHLPHTLAEALFAARARYGGNRPVLEGHDGQILTYNALIVAAHALARKLAAISRRGECVGVLLPTSIGAVVVLFALQFGARTPAMLNYTASLDTLRASCDLARVRTILTSRRFVREAHLQKLIDLLAKDRSVIFIEDLIAQLSWLDRLVAFVHAHAPQAFPNREPNSAAVVLFTSGTTGDPKGVVLSHANLLANIEQCRRHTPFDPSWVFFNTLPSFHAFGLTGGVLLPLLSGLKTVLYPSPLHRETIPVLIDKTQANVLIATDTFAAYYVQAAKPGALTSLRYVVLGAERVRNSTREAFAAASPAAVLEGYGATECAPVVAVNQPDANRHGAVGRLLPGIEIRIEPVAGLTEGGLLFVRGPNVMEGYLRPDGGIEPPPDGWFDTGDLVTLDEDGFLSIVGRLKRFARIGAEMVSLARVEAHAQCIWPMAQHAAIVASAGKDADQIVLVTDQPDATKAPLIAWAQERGVRLLELPQHIIIIEQMPVLPTGKTDYSAIRSMLAERFCKT